MASFDSATVLHAGLAAALRGQPFPHLGHSASAAAAVRVGGRLPWPLLRRLYTRIGASEDIDPHRLSDIDLAAVAQWLADGYPQRRNPGHTRRRRNRTRPTDSRTTHSCHVGGLSTLRSRETSSMRVPASKYGEFALMAQPFGGGAH
ncbi:MAG: hypothetical protein M3460_06770 [Actinomycetota bacterium]|nr:hypothetical protein [Actinomycetota bacterium]